MRHLFCAILIPLCLISCTESNFRTSFWNIPYDSLEEAEKRLVAYYDSIDDAGICHDRFNEELVDLVLNDTSTISYPFQLLQDHDRASVITSDDGRLRCYSWDNLNGGTCVSYSNIVQYRFADKIYAHNTSIFDLISGKTSEEYTYGCDVRQIHTLQTGGQPIYLIYTFERESSNLGCSCVFAVKIVGDKIVPVNIFLDQEEERQSFISIEHTIADWYFTANNGEGWDWLFRFDTNIQTLYVPVAEPEITDQYTLYQFNGKIMDKRGQCGGFWLHPSIRNFKRLFNLFETEEYRIRVDEVDDGSYRYASWSVGQDMSEQPQIIIYNGTLREDDKSCFFENENYTYIVDGDKLTILNPNKKVILQQSRATSE